MNIVNKLRSSRPLVLNVTNQVSMDFVANGLLALGASPIMSHSIDEVDELVTLSDAVVINIGTLDKGFVALAHRAAEVATVKKKPLVLDPVGAGATQLRTQVAKNLLAQHRFSIVRGNASEIMALVDIQATTKGVDSCHTSLDALDAARSLSARANTVVAVSGQSDLIVLGEKYEFLCGGSETMTRVVGMGCLLTAVIGAMHAVHSDAAKAAVAACQLFNVCGEKLHGQPSGSFKTAFLDELFCVGAT